MRCPRCFLADIPEGARTCVLCGYSPDAQQPAAAGSAARPTPPARPARAGRAAAADTSAPADPRGSPAPTAVAEELDASPTELDARRELAAEFRIEALVRGSPEPIVYLAWDGDDRPLTLKAAARQQLGPVADRFPHAAEAAMQLEHSHIVAPVRFGCTDQFLWYATQRVEGRSLESILETVGSLELSTCVRFLEQVASALDHAHRRGVAHGGLRSDCVIVGANEWVQVSDFVVGGLFQIPPDAARASEPGPRADQYALAALAYECLTGAPGRDAAPLSRLLDARADIPLHVSQALRRALSARPAERFPTVLDFVTALGGPTAAAPAPAPSTSWLEGAPQRSPRSPIVIVADEEEEDEELEGSPRPPARRPGRLLIAAGLVIVLGGGAVWLNTSSAPASQTTTAYDAGIPPDTAPLRTPERHRTDTAVASVTPQPAPPAATAESRVETRPPRRPEPAAVKRTPVVRRATPAPPPPRVERPIERPAEPALLSVNAVPWGSVYLDGQPVGNTPQIELHVPSGSHQLRVERDGYRPYERRIDLAPGQRLRITDITLVER